MRRLLLLLVLAASTTLALAPPAHAGGPTSVLVTDPATGRVAALYFSDAAYAGLDRILADGERLAGEPGGLGAALNVTWLIHDVEPWRTQRVFLGAEGGPVVATYGTEAMRNAGDVVWTRPADGQALRNLVQGVLAGAPASAAPPPSASRPAADPVVRERVVTETAWWSLAGWRWAVVGLVAGAGAALLVTRRRTRDPEPRQVLIDA
ncbi:hypothetical protein [Nocardioides aquiterrae]|uniref:Uncharacterized protein n=1 Tax=Nocardioides aquiterrae TaxID=203799 RepID=A0ABP4F2X1_9ACTN